MGKKMKTQLLLVLMAFVLILSGCNFNSSEGTSSGDSGEGEGSTSQVLNVSATADIPTLDSTKAHDAVAFTVLNNVNEGLYRQDENHQPIEALVTEHTTNEDQTVTRSHCAIQNGAMVNRSQHKILNMRGNAS